MEPYDAVAQLGLAYMKVDDAVATLSSARPAHGSGPAAQSFAEARERLLAHATAARADVDHAHRAVTSFAIEVTTP